MIKDYDKLPSRGKECSDGEKTRNCGCGSRAYVFYNENSRYSVECENCGELVNFKTLSHDMAIKMWNDMPTSIGRTANENRKPKMCLVEENYYTELKAKADAYDKIMALTGTNDARLELTDKGAEELRHYLDKVRNCIIK